MPSFNNPKVTNPINSDVSEIRELLKIVAKQDYTGATDLPIGTKRIVDITGGVQLQKYADNSWSSIGKLMHDVDQLDGYHASLIAAKKTIPVYNDNAQLVGDLTGNAGTATKLQTKRTIDIGGIASADAVEFDGSSNITIPINSINVSEDSLTGIVPIEHGGTGRNDGAATDVVFSNGGKASDYGQLGKSANITGKDLNSLVNAGNYFSSNGTVEQHYPYNMGENIYVNVSEHGIYRKQVLCSENQFWVRDSKDSGASWSGWILLSASRENAFYIYISKSGSDSNSGLDSSNPVLTIARALSIAHKMYPYGLNKSVIFRCGSGDWGDIVLNSLPFVLEFSDYAYSDVSEYSETLPKFTSICSKNSLVSIRNAVVQHIITETSGTITTAGYIRFSRLTAQNTSLIYMAATTAEISTMSGHTAVFYVNQRGQIVSGTTSYKIVENLSLSIAFATLYNNSVIHFNNASFALNSGVSITGKRYEISNGANAISSKTYLDSLPGSTSGTIAVGGHINGIPWGGGTGTKALMDDLSWKTPLLTSGGTVDGFIYLRTNDNYGGAIGASAASILYVTGLAKNNSALGAGYAQFYGTDHDSQPGTAEIVARDASSTSVHSIKATRGGCLADSKHIVRSVNGTNADASGNVALSLPYLPLTGGTLSGGLAVGGPSGYNIASIKDGVSHALLLFRNNNNGAYLWLRDNEDTSAAGAFDLTARLDSSTGSLVGKPNGQLFWNGKHIVRSINNVGADANGNVNITGIRVNNANYSDVLTGVVAGYGGPITLPNYGTWAYVATTNYRGWGAGSSDGASWGGIAAGGTTLNFDSRGTGYLCVRIG